MQEEGYFERVWKTLGSFYEPPENEPGQKQTLSHRDGRLKKNNRGIDPREAYSSLGIDSTSSKDYTKEFKTVASELDKVCKELRWGICIFNPGYPGIQWDNTKENVEGSVQNFKEEMKRKGNHYIHDLDGAYGHGEDNSYCLCNEYKPERSAFETLMAYDKSDWRTGDSYHTAYINEKGIIADRTISKTLRNKIIRDSVDYLGQEYKIHLQAKPEYQISVIREIIKLINKDPKFNGNLLGWKAVVPYSHVTGKLNLAAIVIYPVWGITASKYVLDKIVDHFSNFKVEEIGLDIRPRFNKRVNELIFYAGGAGDQKKKLPTKYFTSKEKIFYKKHVL